jgi:hypothetical protein
MVCAAQRSYNAPKPLGNTMENAEALAEPVVELMTTAVPSTTSISVANSQSLSIQETADVIAYPIPVLDGFGLLVTAIALAAAALWIWRRQ